MIMRSIWYSQVSIDVNTIYASVDLQKKELEKEARRLSKKFRYVFSVVYLRGTGHLKPG